MAQQTEEKQTIKEFIDNLLDDLSSGRITPEAALVAAGQYAGLRKTLLQELDGTLSTQDPEGGLSVDVVTRALRSAEAAIETYPPQFQAERPDTPLSPKDVLERARSLRAAETIVTGAWADQHTKVEELRKTFITRLVKNWIAKTREVGAEEIDEVALTRKLEGVITSDPLGPGATNAMESALSTAPTQKNAAREMVRDAQPARQELAAAVASIESVRAVSRAVFGRAGSPNVDHFATIATHIVTSSGLPAQEAVRRADALSRAAEAASSSIPNETSLLASGRFFSNLAEGPAQKLVAAAADALFAQLSPLAQQNVIRSAFSRALEGALSKTDDLTLRFGKNFVDSELFRVVIEGAKKEFAQEPGGGGTGTRQARSVIEDILGSVLRGPAAAPLLAGPRETILNYFELMAINAGLADDKKLPLFGKTDGLALLLSSPAGNGKAAPSASLVAAAASLSGQLPSWQQYYMMATSLVSPAAASPSSFPSGPGVPQVGFSGGGLGGAISGALAGAGLGLAGLGGRMGGNFLNTIFGGAPSSPFGRRSEKTSFWDDTPLMISVFIGVAIVLLFVLPTFFNVGSIKSNTITSSLLNAAAEAERRGRDRVGGFDKQYPQPPDYLDPSLFTGKEFACLSFGDGFDTGAGTSRKITNTEASRLATVLTKFPQINVLSCGLSCPAKKINITVFSELSDYGGFAPPSHPGNVILYQHVFTNYDDQLLAYLLAHELAHNIDWFQDPLSVGFQKLGCGSVPPSTYHFGGDSHESFAESVALYLINHPEIKTYCDGKAYNYLNGALNQCRQ
ncbi:MAG: hypothetical protein AAB557_02110 [Patescibacteria group bacterium]